MRFWIASVLASACVVQHVASTDFFRDLTSNPVRAAAEMFDAGSLYLARSSRIRRDRLASVELAKDFPQSHPLRRLMPSIGYLYTEFTATDGKLSAFTGTASLIRPGYVMTNHHCLIDGSAKLQRAEVWLGYTGDAPINIIAADNAVAARDAGLDVAILRIAPSAERPSFAATVMREPQPGERLFILHHGAGRPLQVTRSFCTASAEPAPIANSFAHTCPTTKGSSGALVFAESDGAIVGLHKSHNLRTDTVMGYATRITAITSITKQLIAAR